MKLKYSVKTAISSQMTLMAQEKFHALALASARENVVPREAAAPGEAEAG
jgi:hypothetical protein